MMSCLPLDITWFGVMLETWLRELSFRCVGVTRDSVR
jgi:hypothetical protein